jgi:hypothetical protein
MRVQLGEAPHSFAWWAHRPVLKAKAKLERSDNSVKPAYSLRAFFKRSTKSARRSADSLSKWS